MEKSIKYAHKKNEAYILQMMRTQKANGYIKKGTFSNEIVWGKYSYVFSKLSEKKQKSFRKGIFLFGLVRRDVKNFLKRRPNFRIPKKYAQIEYTADIDERAIGRIAGADLNHAYWRIAYNLGIISEYTYTKGLPDEFKSVRLAALSTLGAPKKYQVIREGKLVNEYKQIKGDESLQRVYVLIRHTCYKYMHDVKKMLGKDFLCYKTDAIYYIDSTENRRLVRNYFKEKDLLMKQLV